MTGLFEWAEGWVMRVGDEWSTVDRRRWWESSGGSGWRGSV